ncbi:ABC transporter ATP-binding protein [Shewanella sp. UCD-KL12]|uniref:ABC transporter ATP-binding protein n=1 Tax=Shewanella sp. UCD-KL12 TaxID=1917163 RepID=UPI00097069A4|nr:ABC transporter ATP-binding protein [Shewanella sp. UCD-KL12]
MNKRVDLLKIDELSFRYHCEGRAILDGVSITVKEGEAHCINGPTGSGKSTLLSIIMGGVSRPYEGGLVVSEALMIGLVMQDPNAQLIRQSVGAEVAFALENLAVPPQSMYDKVRHALRRVGLFISLDMPIESLSLGQKYRLMLAAQLVFNPGLLLLDEPWAQLDDIGVAELIKALQALKHEGVAIILVEHNPSAFIELVDHFWQLDKGKLLPGCYRANTIKFACAVTPAIDETHLEIPPLEYRFEHEDPLFRSRKSLALHSGEIVAVVGDNGTGKSSLLKSIAGIQQGVASLPITLMGLKPKLGLYGAELGFLFQRPNRQLFESSVIEELRFSLKRFSLPLENAESLLVEIGLEHLKDHSPHTLSYGQQHLVALASICAFKPKVLLLDDPFAGLDQIYTCRVWQLLIRLSQQGTSILLTSHRLLPHTPVSRYWRIADGELFDQASIEESVNVG